MYTVIETPVYSNKVRHVLSDEERDAFAVFISANPTAGAVVRGSGGIRKVRWPLRGKGKSGGARVVYFNRLANGEIWLLSIYSKSDRSSISAKELKLLKEAIDND